MKTIDKRIESAFARYKSTIDLLESFIRAKSHTQEFILLVCARLDSLSNLAFHRKSQKDNFTDFLFHHSGHKSQIHSVSLPDLYEYLNYHNWVLPGTVQKDGRLHVFDPRRDDKYIAFLWNSGVPITQKHVSGLLRVLMSTIRKRYRVLPNQKLTLTSIDSQENVVNFLSAVMRKRMKRLFIENADITKDLAPLVREFSLASLLYREYRCGIIHQYGVSVDPAEFYSRKDIYFRTLYNDFVTPGRRLTIQFPAKFLLDVLRTSLESYKSRLLHTKQLPIDIFSEICDFMKELKYLDDESIETGRDVGITLTAGNSK